MSHHELLAQFIGDSSGFVIPTPTYKWLYAGNANSIPAGNDGNREFVTLTSDSDGRANEAYLFNYLVSARIRFTSVNFGANDFSIYTPIIKLGNGDPSNDILSNHTGDAGWTIERGGSGVLTYRFYWFELVASVVTLNSTSAFTITQDVFSALFVIRSGDTITVKINGSVVATGTMIVPGGSIISYNGGMMMSGIAVSPGTHNAHMLCDGFAIWDSVALTDDEQAQQIIQGLHA